MTDKRERKVGLEVESQTLREELVAIKDRLSAIEVIQGISNADVVKKYVQEHLKTRDAIRIMSECEEPRTKSHLQQKFGYNSKPALNHHLKPLLDATLLREKIEADGTILFEWSGIFRSLPKSVIRAILRNIE